MKDKVALETEVYACISDKLVQQDAEIQYNIKIVIGMCLYWRAAFAYQWSMDH
jgi:hypothetical protein